MTTGPLQPGEPTLDLLEERDRGLLRLRDHPRRYELIPFVVAIIVIVIVGIVSIRHQADQRTRDNAERISQLCDGLQIAVPNALDSVLVQFGADEGQRTSVRTAFVAGLAAELQGSCPPPTTVVALP